jgi:hypothetical protein
MTMRFFLGAAFIGMLALLIHNRYAARERARKNEPTPTYLAGDVPGYIGMLVLCGSLLLELEDPLLMIAAIIGCLFTAVSIAIYIAARRRESRRAI